MPKCATALVFSMLAFAGLAGAQPTVYVSDFSGHRILAINGTTGGSPTVVFTGAQIGVANFSPEDLVVGPDGKLYICDSLNGRIWRFDPLLPVTMNATPPNPQLVVQFLPGVYPEGPSFSGSDDLYVNSRGAGTGVTGGTGAQGVWVVPNIATSGTSAPYTPLQIIPSIGASGEGTTFEAFGNLLMVDQSGNRVVSARWNGPGSSPNFGPSFTPLITTNLAAPIGIAVNTCGDVLVGTGNRVQRFTLTKSDTGQLAAQFGNTYVTFPTGQTVAYMERDAANNLYVVTNSASADKLWKIAPTLDASNDPISSCTTGVLPAYPLSTLKNLFPVSRTQMFGVAVTPTDFTPAAKTFTPSNPSNTINYGPFTLTLTYKQVLTVFTQTFTAIMSEPSEVLFAGVFPPGTEAMRFPSLGGFVIQFRTASQPPGCASFAACGVPVPGVDFAPSDGTHPAFQISLAFHDPVQGFRNPGLAHLSHNTPILAYTDDVTHDFWVLFDQTTRGSGGLWGSDYTAFDAPFEAGLALPLAVKVDLPVADGSGSFQLGNPLTVTLTVTDAKQRPVPGLRLRLSVARISPLPIVLQDVVAFNGAGIDNVINDNGNGTYSIRVQTRFLTAGPGTYQFTVFGNGFPPLAFNVQFRM